jgi:hypothetical protein
MEAILRMKMAASAILLSVYVAFVVLNLSVAFGPLLEMGKGYLGGGAMALAGVPKAFENVANEAIYGKQFMVNAYSFVQVLLDKDEENNFEVVKDLEGNGHFTWFQGYPWVEPLVFQRIKALKEKLPSKTKLIAILPPDKQLRGYTKFARGLPNNRINEIADFYLSELQKMGIDVFDTRGLISSSGIKKEDLFYKSDHHWRLETSFWAFVELAKFMHDSYKFPVDAFYLDRNNYNAVTYKKMFVGSMLKKSGIPFLEADDLSLIYPKFSTDYDFSIDMGDGTQEESVNIRGRFERVFYHPDSSKKYVYVHYGSILWDMQPIRHIQNMSNRSAPKILIIQDSFGWPVTSFLAALCSDIWIIDPRIYEKSYSDFIREKTPDYVFIFYNLQGFNLNFFTAAMEN